MPQEWIMGLAGGLTIGIAGAIYLLGAGRIMGASGIIGGLVDGSGRDTALDRLWFLAGLIATPAILMALFGLSPHTNASSAPAVLVLAGVLVGVGTRLANGCTSGHGVCGLSRLSPRAIVATALYISAGMLAMAVLRHIWGVI
ncbi:YeeE/YedE family protein [Phaeobacter sp. B1627]|uniref:YeeE/YedE family protein n=1 Tax=Phaeobacter sp. B1627 TaxID=2583809 RepID=UPI00111878F8|nr:YeeE/YedE thiosulfate transporter family protein [Phaeobacter sp. B1627]TNJ43913.1 YeeE/YedE family protein [Phaeobacter sp. B1627]